MVFASKNISDSCSYAQSQTFSAPQPFVSARRQLSSSGKDADPPRHPSSLWKLRASKSSPNCMPTALPSWGRTMASLDSLSLMSYTSKSKRFLCLEMSCSLGKVSSRMSQGSRSSFTKPGLFAFLGVNVDFKTDLSVWDSLLAIHCSNVQDSMGVFHSILCFRNDSIPPPCLSSSLSHFWCSSKERKNALYKGMQSAAMHFYLAKIKGIRIIMKKPAFARLASAKRQSKPSAFVENRMSPYQTWFTRYTILIAPTQLLLFLTYLVDLLGRSLA